jgi:tetratricopeptide (TPR) repeat protein
MILMRLKDRIILILLITFLGNTARAQGEIDFILKATALSESGKTGDAIGVLNRAIETMATSRLYVQRGELHFSVNDLSSAIQDFNQGNRIDEHSGDFGLAKAYAVKGDASTSLYHLGMHLESVYKKSEKEIMLDPSFGKIENRPEWRQFWKKDWYNSAERNRSEIEFLTSGKRIEDTRGILAEMKRNYPESEETLYSEALINIASGKYNEAIVITVKLTELNPSNAKYLRLLAKGQEGQLNYAGASGTYSKLLESGVAEARILLSRAQCYRRTGETDKAKRDIERFLEYYPEDKSALSIAGKVEAESGDNLKALEYFSKNLKLHPNDADCYIDRANSYFASKSWKWAADDYSMSLDLKPDNPEVWLNRGISLLSAGNVKDACHDFKRSYSLGNQKASSYLSRNCIGQ